MAARKQRSVGDHDSGDERIYVRLHPDDIAAIADEVIQRMQAPRPRAKRHELPTVTPAQQQGARAQLERLGLVAPRKPPFAA